MKLEQKNHLTGIKEIQIDLLLYLQTLLGTLDAQIILLDSQQAMVKY
jgi:hypothetical protein